MPEFCIASINAMARRNPTALRHLAPDIFRYRSSIPGKPHEGFRDHYEAIREILGVVFEKSLKGVYLVGGSLVIQTQENDTAVRTMFFEYLLAEVLIVGDQNPVLGERFLYDLIVPAPRASSKTENTSCPRP
jgi:hypothetical protein